jgi:hypothetical protein
MASNHFKSSQKKAEGNKPSWFSTFVDFKCNSSCSRNGDTTIGLILLWWEELQELPYRIEQQHISWKVLKDGSIRIQQLLLVEKEGHRKILIGKNGDVIR